MRRISTLMLVAATAFIPLVRSVPAHAASASTNAKTPVCAIHSNPSQVESGIGDQHSSIADVIQVECEPIYSEVFVMIDATQLSNACRGTLAWTSPPNLLAQRADGPQYVVQLDNDGNAIAVVAGGPCSPTTNRISASLLAPPFTTAATSFTTLPPTNTKPGVTANPKSIVEDSVYSAVATVVQVEFPSVYAAGYVTLKSDGLNTRCNHTLNWYGPGGFFIATGSEATVQLDNDGNAFALVIAGPSCASGRSTITADLTTVPFTNYVGPFKILSPRPTI